ncbi:MAG TPA: type II 3-dehydroquinate dehydratase [Dehalococcoidia bacterium]|nr:type II 3-dehydroquinate dehydratase [Dehalococcoidia bacterium]
MRILLISGPNLNNLGKRDPEQYGTQTLPEIEGLVQKRAEEWQAEIRPYQSNHEGAIIDFIQQESTAEGMIINAGALTHYGLALRDAIEDFPGLVVEVHLSNIFQREEFRHTSVTAPVASGLVSGLGWRGYLAALDALIGMLHEGAKA